MGESFQGVGRKSGLRIPDHRQLHRPRPPARSGRKGGSEDQAIGRSRGGLSTKINAVVDALGNPLRFILTAGQTHDIRQAEDLISGLSFQKLLADKGYDSNRFRDVIAAAGAEAVMPSNRSRSQALGYDKEVYKERNLIERFFNKIKHFRRIATRYDKTALSFASMLSLVGAMIWLR
jgi:transposase